MDVVFRGGERSPNPAFASILSVFQLLFPVLSFANVYLFILELHDFDECTINLATPKSKVDPPPHKEAPGEPMNKKSHARLIEWKKNKGIKLITFPKNEHGI